MTSTYNPTAQFEVKEWDVDFRQVPTRMLKARVYQPQGPGPFPTLLDLHGGAWHDKDRFANVPMCQAVAKSPCPFEWLDITQAPTIRQRR
jgi:acetyl esterase/lipase